jgi:hypothetical protein
MTRRDRTANLTSAELRERKERRFILFAGLALVVIAAVLYALNIVVFRTSRDTFYYFWIDLAFIPLEVLIVAVIVERVISRREKGAITQKLNMVIGAFFSELGTPLLAKLLPTNNYYFIDLSWLKASIFKRLLTGGQGPCDDVIYRCL